MVTLGPFFRDLSQCLDRRRLRLHPGNQSVFTAGIVMGVMLIPVRLVALRRRDHRRAPVAMRDGSYWRSAPPEVRNHQASVILPAALPGIVGALLLTASRAIGETMIVVLAAGVAARLTINPFEADDHHHREDRQPADG